jgi:non-canonical (house-cleaning) NTP pyrophosphatase
MANQLVGQLHRHHAPIPGGFAWWAVGAVVDGDLVGCAIAGRPTNRNNDDQQTVEVLRVATNGAPNAPSALLGACARAAKALGARRIITYTLDSESGVSLRGAGWVQEADGITSWWTHPGADGNGRTPGVHRPHSDIQKVRWGLTFRDAVNYRTPSATPATTGQMELL